jgi:hypothetical protein
VGKTERRSPLGRNRLRERMILKGMLKEQEGGGAWTGFVWLKM